MERFNGGKLRGSRLIEEWIGCTAGRFGGSCRGEGSGKCSAEIFRNIPIALCYGTR